MGGSSGGYTPPPRDYGSRGEAVERDCYQLRFETHLRMNAGGPVQAKGAVLEVLEMPVTPRTDTLPLTGMQEDVPAVPRVPAVLGPRLAAIDDDGKVVGTILDQASELLRCMGEGIAYVADVLDATADVNKVWIRPSDVSRAAGIYGIDGEVTTGSFSVKVVSQSDENTDVIAGPNRISRESTCELRSLLRIPVRFEANVGPSGDAEVNLK